jgi:ATP-dependent RNA helicase RhlE
MPDDVRGIASSLLRNPKSVAVAPVSSTAELIDQSVYFVNRSNKRKLLLELIEAQNIRRGIVFTRTKAIANRVSEFLTKSGVNAMAIHGNKSQSARQRALQSFRDGETRILVASDLAARGLDIDAVTHVFNFDLPEVPETYVHRIGRTGRAEARGLAIAFCDYEERDLLRQIEKLVKKPIPVVKEHGYVETMPVGNDKEPWEARREQQNPRSGQRPRGGRGPGMQQRSGQRPSRPRQAGPRPDSRSPKR